MACRAGFSCCAACAATEFTRRSGRIHEIVSGIAGGWHAGGRRCAIGSIVRTAALAASSCCTCAVVWRCAGGVHAHLCQIIGSQAGSLCAFTCPGKAVSRSLTCASASARRSAHEGILLRRFRFCIGGGRLHADLPAAARSCRSAARAGASGFVVHAARARAGCACSRIQVACAVRFRREDTGGRFQLGIDKRNQSLRIAGVYRDAPGALQAHAG